MKQFLIDGSGKCSSCAQDVSQSDILVCCSCSLSFHALCTSVEKQNYLTTASFLKTYQKAKDNFKWFCDECLTKFEVSKRATVEDRIGHLVEQVSQMAQNMNELSNTVSTLKASQPNSCLTGSTKVNNVWSDAQRIQSVKSSLVIKPVAGDTAKTGPDLAKLKDIAVKNHIQVSNFGKSKTGNTFIHCSSAADRDKLRPLLAESYSDREIVPLKEKLPHVTIVDILKTDNEEVTTDTILSQIRSQNPSITQLIDAGEDFKVMFIKSNTSSSDKCSAVVKLSCKIREAIRSNRNRIFIGITSCRVYDRFFVKRCNKCQEFGHYKENCTKADVCGYCSGDHPSEECRHKDSTDLTVLKCANCKANNMECSGHSAFWSKCPSYIIAQKRLKSTVPYYDNHPCTATYLNG